MSAAASRFSAIALGGACVNAHNGHRTGAAGLRSSVQLLRRQRLQLAVEVHVRTLEPTQPVIPGIAHAHDVAIVALSRSRSTDTVTT